MPTGPALTWGSSGASSGSVSFTLGSTHRPTVPRIFRFGFIRSRLSSSSKSLRFSSRSPLVRATTPAGVSSLFAASPSTSTPPSFVWGPPCGGAGAPNLPLRSALRFSQPLGGLLRRRFRGPVSSRCHVQGFMCAVQGLLPFRSGDQLIAGPCPHAVDPSTLTGDPAATYPFLDFGALFCGAMRSSGSGFSLPFRRSPLRLSPPAGPRFTTVNPAPRAIRS